MSQRLKFKNLRLLLLLFLLETFPLFMFKVNKGGTRFGVVNHG